MQSNAEMQRYNYLISEIDAVYHEAALRFGMSDSAMMVLYVLASRDGVCLLSEMPRVTGLSKQTIHSALRKLEAGGVVESEAVGARKKVLRLTEAGQRRCAETVARLIASENEIFEDWQPSERSLYLALTKRYLDGLRARVERM